MSGNMNRPEPPPTPNARPAVWDLVIADMRERDAEGIRKYGTRLQPGNGRDPLVDAYQEALDLVVYLRQAIAERDDAPPAPDPLSVEGAREGAPDWRPYAEAGHTDHCAKRLVWGDGECECGHLTPDAPAFDEGEARVQIARLERLLFDADERAKDADAERREWQASSERRQRLLDQMSADLAALLASAVRQTNNQETT